MGVMACLGVIFHTVLRLRTFRFVTLELNMHKRFILNVRIILILYKLLYDWYKKMKR